MTRWLLISAVVIVGQLLLAYVVGSLLRRASDSQTAAPAPRPLARELAFAPPAPARRLSNRWRAVGR